MRNVRNIRFSLPPQLAKCLTESRFTDPIQVSHILAKDEDCCWHLSRKALLDVVLLLSASYP